MRAKPSNHCLPILDILITAISDNQVILVLPLLQIFIYPDLWPLAKQSPNFGGSSLSHMVSVELFLTQILLRDCNSCIHTTFLIGWFFASLRKSTHWLAQGDVNYNVMMDGTHLSLSPIHPCHAWKQHDGLSWARFFSRTVRPVKYYLINFSHFKYPSWRNSGFSCGAWDPTIWELGKTRIVIYICGWRLLYAQLDSPGIYWPSFSSLLYHAHSLVRATKQVLEDAVSAL